MKKGNALTKLKEAKNDVLDNNDKQSIQSPRLTLRFKTASSSASSNSVILTGSKYSVTSGHLIENKEESNTKSCDKSGKSSSDKKEPCSPKSSSNSNLASADHTYSSSSDTNLTKAPDNGLSLRPRKRLKTSSETSAGNKNEPINQSSWGTGSTPLGKKSHRHRHHYQKSEKSGKKRLGSSSSSSEEESTADAGCDKPDVSQPFTLSSNVDIDDVNSIKSTNVSKPNSPENSTSTESDTSSPKVPPLRIVISTTSANGSNSSQQPVSFSTTSENQKFNSSNSAPCSNPSSKSLSYSVSTASLEEISNEETPSNLANLSSGRVTRSSQRAAQQNKKTSDSNHKETDENRQAISPSSSCITIADSDLACEKGDGAREKELREGGNRKRKNRNKTPQSNASSNKGVNNNATLSITEEDENETTSSASSSGDKFACSSNLGVVKDSTPREFQMPLYNCYNMYLNIRKQVDKRRNQFVPVHPKPPSGFKDYLFNKGSYFLEGNVEKGDSRLSERPSSLCSHVLKLNPESPLFYLMKSQEKSRNKLEIRHKIEKEKLCLAMEQEVLRVHGRAALALANQSLPFSFCTILKDEEIYNTIEDTESNGNEISGNHSKNEYPKPLYTFDGNASSSADLSLLLGNPENHGSRSRYNGRLFSQWLKDIEDKWEKIKESVLQRQKKEAESLQAIQKMDWEWKGKEIGYYDSKNTGIITIGDCCVPSVKVNDDFSLLPR